MEVKIVESQGIVKPFNEEVLVVSFNDSNFTTMTRKFFNKFNEGSIMLEITEKNELVFRDVKTKDRFAIVNGVYKI